MVCIIHSCGLAATTISTVVAASTYVPTYINCDIQLQNVAPDDGQKSPKHVESLMIN